MAEVSEAYVKNHRHQQLMVLALFLSALLLSILPRQERSLFIVPAAALRGFGAIVPLDESRLPWFPFGLNLDFPPAGYFVRVPGRPAAPGDGPFIPAGVTPTAPVPGFVTPLEPAAPGAPLPGDFTPGAAGGVGGPGFGGGFPFAPASLSPATASPAGQPVTAANVPITDTIPAVPEPGTWLLMIIGFLSVGAAIRYGRPDRPAHDRAGEAACTL